LVNAKMQEEQATGTAAPRQTLPIVPNPAATRIVGVRAAVIYYTAKNEDLDDLRPMTRGESIETYWNTVDDEPDRLADLYIDFHDFSRVEFLIFKDRLSSSILISKETKKAILTLETKFETMRDDGSYIVPGWGAESGISLDEALAVTRYAYGISIGATITTAVAALESLLIDLAPAGTSKQLGLSRHLQAFLERYKVPVSEAENIAQLGRTVGRRRNTFAHSLTGSYWETDASIAAMFTPETMEDTLYTIGKLAVLIEEIVLDGPSRS
jgi:hypothetical protein